MFGLHGLDMLTLGVYLVGIMVAGLWVARKVKNVGDYFMGGRRFGKAFMIMHAFGTGTHTDQAVSVAGASYKLGREIALSSKSKPSNWPRSDTKCAPRASGRKSKPTRP